MADRSRRQDPLAVWAGKVDRDFWQGATQVAVVNRMAFGYQDLGEWQAVALERALAGMCSGATRA